MTCGAEAACWGLKAGHWKLASCLQKQYNSAVLICVDISTRVAVQGHLLERCLSMQARRAVLLSAGRQVCYRTPRNSALTTSSWCCPMLLPCTGSRLLPCAVQTQLDVLVGYTRPTLRSAKPCRQCVDVAGENVHRHPVWASRGCRLLADFSCKAAYSRLAPGKQSQGNPMYSTKCVRRSLAGLPMPVPLHQPSSMQRWQLRLRASPSTRLNGIAGSTA